MIRTFGACLMLLLAACATSPAKLQITPESKTGAVVLVSLAAPVAYELSTEFYNPETKALDKNFFGPLTPSWDVAASKNAQVAVAEAQPGRYVITYLSQQDHWGVCFHANTMSFEVKPGEAVFLGVFDPQPHLRQLSQLVVSSGRMTASQATIVHFFDDITPPAFRPATEDDLKAAQTGLAIVSPGITSPLRPATFQPAKFGAGTDAFGVQRVCSGWYTGSAKE